MKRPRLISVAVCSAVLAIAGAIVADSARAQGAPAGPLYPKPGVTPEKEPPPALQKHVIRTRVTEVTAPVTVTNPQTGEMVLDLTKETFHVFDNGAEQKIDHFDLGGDPLSVVLLAETSSHVAAMLPAVRQAGIVFTETVMGQTAEAAVLSFDDTVDLQQSFTTDVDAVQRAINRLPVGSSGIHLYDGMARGIQLLEQRPAVQRRILVVVGEAQDDGSENKLGEVLRHAELANVTIYSIGLSTTAADFRQPAGQYVPPQIGPPGTYPLPTPNGMPPTPELEQATQGNMDLGALLIWLVKTGKNAIGSNSLEVASKATGGLHVNTMHDRSIQKAMDAIGGELHAQYTLGYRPPGDEPSGYHEIKVTVDRPGVKVRTRPGYYIPPPES
ncbi:MAG TPA: VWA domain-containing protein [Candidatus Acidoferrum sp.]|nr:VWA domain-containing protein [Candidatus Acidoferrum sp.]